MSLSQQVQPHRTPAPLGLVTSIIIAALGGFVGGLLIEHGPTYLNVHVTQPVLGTSEYAEIPSVPLVVTEVPIEAPVDEPIIEASGADGRIVIHSEKSTYLVLEDSASAKLGKGPIKSQAHEDMLTTLSQKVAPDDLAPGQRAWLGAQVTLFDAKGYACSGTIDRLELIQQYAGDGMQLETWDEYAHGPLLVARVSKTQGNCAGSRWARHADRSAPSVARLSKGTKKERREARTAFRTSPTYKELQKHYEAEGLKGQWDSYWDNELNIQVVRSPEQELIFVQARVGGCGEFDAQLGAVFIRREDGSLQALPHDNHFLGSIEAAADIDGDGDIDLITGGDGYDRSLMLGDKASLSVDTHSEVGIYYCRC